MVKDETCRQDLFSFGLSSLDCSSLTEERNSRMPLPSAPPISGNRPAPKRTMTITRMMMSSAGPRFGIVSLQISTVLPCFCTMSSRMSLAETQSRRNLWFYRYVHTRGAKRASGHKTMYRRYDQNNKLDCQFKRRRYRCRKASSSRDWKR